MSGGTDYRLAPDAVHGRVNTGAEQIHRARLRVATEATDADDCRLLLEALGIDRHGELITW